LRHLVTTIALSVLVLSAAPAPAQETDPPNPIPPSDERDWIQFASGEWLAGEILGLRDEDFDFDSEELEELSLDWEDIAQLHSPRVLTWVLEDGSTRSGPSSMRDGEVVVITSSGEQRFPRREALRIIAGPPREANYWSGLFSLGAIGRSGNTDQSDLTMLARLRRDGPRTVSSLRYDGSLGTLDGDQNVNNHRVSANVHWLLYRNLYFTMPAIEFYADRFQNISRRWTVGGGLGIYVVRRGPIEWSVTLGLGYQDTRYRSVDAGEDDSGSTASLIPSTSLSWDLSGSVELDFDYNATVGVPETRNAYHHAVALLSVDLWAGLDLDTSLTWDRVESPRADSDGNVPQRDDLRTFVGIGYDF
jgi:hypothetical protein